jgi:hypothetical protein
VPGLCSALSSSMNCRVTISRITSRSVEYSLAVSLESSANLRIRSSKTVPTAALSTTLGCRSSAERCCVSPGQSVVQERPVGHTLDQLSGASTQSSRRKVSSEVLDHPPVLGLLEVPAEHVGGRSSVK